MNQDFFNALIKWAITGRRSIKVELDNISLDGSIKVFCYDYAISEGCWVDSIDEIPTQTQLKQQKKDAAQAILDGL